MSKRDKARQSIVVAARELLEERSWSSITVDELTSQAGLSRTAFYLHFTDREDLLLTLLTDLSDSLHDVAGHWVSGEAVDPVVDHARAIDSLVGIFVSEGRLLQAVSDAAVADPHVAAAWQQLATTLVDATTDGIQRDIARGLSSVDHPEAISVAINVLMRAYLLQSFGRRPLDDPAVVAATLKHIVTSALYGDGSTSPE